MKRLGVIICVMLAIGSICQAQDESDSQAVVKNIKAALQNRQYEEAARLADSSASAEEVYLKALALFYGEEYARSIEACNEVIQEHKSSTWLRKAIFLKAACHIKLKQFQEAEEIYDAEVRRLLSAARKEEIAGIYFRFAEAVSRKPEKDELDAPPPDYRKAHELYAKALELEIGREMRDEAMFRLGRMMHLAGDYGQSIGHYRRYLDEFDPDWMGAVDSPRRQKKAAGTIEKGKHIHKARFHLAECQVAQN